MGENLTIAVAIGAGLLSFLSPCVLPLVPAYIGQLSAVAVVGRASGEMSRWLAVRHAVAYVAGFGSVFTILGLTATYLAGPLVDVLPLLRQVGGILLILLGLNLAGILKIPALDRSWRPLDAGAAGSLATASGTVALGSPGAAAAGPVGEERLVAMDRDPIRLRRRWGCDDGGREGRRGEDGQQASHGLPPGTPVWPGPYRTVSTSILRLRSAPVVPRIRYSWPA